MVAVSLEKLYISAQKKKNRNKKKYQHLWYQLKVTSMDFYIDT